MGSPLVQPQLPGSTSPACSDLISGKQDRPSGKSREPLGAPLGPALPCTRLQVYPPSSPITCMNAYLSPSRMSQHFQEAADPLRPRGLGLGFSSHFLHFSHFSHFQEMTQLEFFEKQNNPTQANMGQKEMWSEHTT